MMITLFRFGKKYGFNFNDHYNERVGVLRAFVKKYKNKNPEKGDDGKAGKKKYFSFFNLYRSLTRI